MQAPQLLWDAMSIGGSCSPSAALLLHQTRLRRWQPLPAGATDRLHSPDSSRLLRGPDWSSVRAGPPPGCQCCGGGCVRDLVRSAALTEQSASSRLHQSFASATAICVRQLAHRSGQFGRALLGAPVSASSHRVRPNGQGGRACAVMRYAFAPLGLETAVCPKAASAARPRAN